MIREVTPDEIPVSQSEYVEPIVWAGIFDGPDLVGHGCVSVLHGKAWAHDLKHWGKDPYAVLALYRMLTAEAKARGVDQIFTDVSDENMLNLYKALGWQVSSVILEGRL